MVHCFFFFQGNLLLNFVLCFQKFQAWQKEQRKHFPSFQSCDDDRSQMPSCIRAVQMWCSCRMAGPTSCSLSGCFVEEGANVVQDHPSGFHVPLSVSFLSWWERAPLWLLQLLIGKENKAAEAHLFLICNHLLVGEAPPCETLPKLQIDCRSSAVSWPVHNYLKHFGPYCVLSIHQAATAVSDQLWQTPPLTVTTSDTLGFVFHYSSGFLRPDRVVFCCLSYKINL